MRLILASKSAGRRALLEAAGVPHDVMTAPVDEEAAKAAFRAEGLSPRDQADALAELKAVRVAAPEDALVLGCDQMLDCGGRVFDKPASRADAAEQLRALRGRSHRLLSAAVIVEAGRPVWRHVGVATLQVRDFSDGFLDAYLDAEWPAIGGCVGGYRVEGPGMQLFDRIEGDQPTIVGLPLLPLLAYLRTREVLAS